MLVVMGCLIGGPINIITSAVAVDLSENAAICGRSDLMAVTGIINGFGCVIASLGLSCVGPIQAQYGWKIVWYLLAGCAIVGTALLTPIIRRELVDVDADHDNDDCESQEEESQILMKKQGKKYQSLSATNFK